MNERLARALAGTGIIVLVSACGQAPPNVQVAASTFTPTDMAQVADASALRVMGTVRSEARLHEVPPDPAEKGEEPAPSVFSYEIVQIEVESVLGPEREGASPGDVLDVGVPVLTAPSDVAVEDSELFVKAGETFVSGVGARGVFFLTAARPLGSFGTGHEVMGFAEQSTQDRDATVVRGMAGDLAGTKVPSKAVNAAAERPRRR